MKMLTACLNNIIYCHKLKHRKLGLTSLEIPSNIDQSVSSSKIIIRLFFDICYIDNTFMLHVLVIKA